MRLWSAILAFLQILSGGLGALNLVDLRWVGLLVLVVGALQGATVAYQGKRPEIDSEASYYEGAHQWQG